MNNQEVEISESTLSIVALKTKWNDFRDLLPSFVAEYCTDEQADKMDEAVSTINEFMDTILLASANEVIYESHGTKM